MSLTLIQQASNDGEFIRPSVSKHDGTPHAVNGRLPNRGLLKHIFAFLVLSILACVLVTGCHKNQNPIQPTDELTDQQKQEIQTAHQSVLVLADTALASQNPANAFQQILSRVQSINGVANAWISGNGLFVEYKNGGEVGWYAAPPEIVPPYMPSSQVKPSGSSLQKGYELIGNKKVALVNVPCNDESRISYTGIINELKSDLENNDYSVAIKNGIDANVEFLKHLSDYGLLYYISHGSYDGTHIWLQTGYEIGIIEELFDRIFYSDWRDGSISALTVSERRGGVDRLVRYVWTSERFIEKYNSNLPHSMVYLAGCQALKANNMAQAFSSKGAAVVVGWNETQSKAPTSGQLLIATMLGGKILADAISSLPDEARHEDLEEAGQDIHADLVYYPPSGKSIELKQNVPALTVDLVSPQDGTTYTNRVVTVQGSVSDPSVAGYAILSVNGVSTSLGLSSQNAFYENVVIKSGSNTIEVRFYSSQGFASKTVTIFGDFPSLDLWTELRWNTDQTDVDFHLLPPGNDIPDLWTSQDCYYGNKQTFWGASLDVDVTTGYGPEHITIVGANVPGIYRLFLHYYASNGYSGGNTQAFVTFAVRGGGNQNFGPYNLTNPGTSYSYAASGARYGDLWEICRIDFPSGQVTPINIHYNLGLQKTGAPAASAHKKR